MLSDWAQRHRVDPQALSELIQILGPGLVSAGEPGASEAYALAKIRLETNITGGLLLRNNSGAAVDGRGIPVRFGLGNDSAKLNKKFKSSDLIGLTPLVIRPEHVGRTWGVFTAVEVKKPGWKYTATDREKAQLFFINSIRARGGIGIFATAPGDYTNSIAGFLK